MTTSYIGADVHCKFTEVAVERHGEIVMRDRVRTDISSLRDFLQIVPKPRVVVIEEGTMSGWLSRNLRADVEEFVVCDPWRNKMIWSDGDKTDPLDAAGLAALQRGGYTRAVYHTDDEERLALKEIVALYHDRMHEAVRQINKLRAQGRAYGVRIPARVLKHRSARATWMATVEPAALMQRLSILWRGWDTVQSQVKLAKAQMVRQAGDYPVIAAWQDLPGVGVVRAATLFAYLDTPWRFGSVKKLWKYCGLGLKHRASGTDKNGRPRKGRLSLYRRANSRLKDALLGAAVTAIYRGRGNPFSEYYARCVKKGMTESNARHAVARKLLTVMWGMWKTNSRYDARQV